MNQIKIVKIAAVIILVFFVVFLAVPIVMAAEQSPGEGSPNEQSPDENSPKENDFAGTKLQNPLGGEELGFKPEDIIGRLANALIAPVGAVAFLFFVVGGFYWIFSGGNDERIKKGKDIMMWSLVGLVVIFSAYAILKFVFAILVP